MLSTSRRTKFVAAAIVGVAIVAAVAIYIERSQGTAAEQVAVADDSTEAADFSTGYPAPRPASIEDLVHSARLVVIGEIGAIARQTTEGPVATGGYRPPPDAPPLPEVPFTYYEVEVETVVASSDPVAAGDTIVLRVPGTPAHSTLGPTTMRMPRTGERLLLVLSTHPEIPGSYEPEAWGIFDISGPEAVFADLEQTPVRTITEKATAADFVKALRQATGSRAP